MDFEKAVREVVNRVNEMGYNCEFDWNEIYLDWLGLDVTNKIPDQETEAFKELNRRLVNNNIFLDPDSSICGFRAVIPDETQNRNLYNAAIKCECESKHSGIGRQSRQERVTSVLIKDQIWV